MLNVYLGGLKKKFEYVKYTFVEKYIQDHTVNNAFEARKQAKKPGVRFVAFEVLNEKRHFWSCYHSQAALDADIRATEGYASWEQLYTRKRRING